MSTTIEIDDSRWPRVYVTWKPIVMNDEQWQEFIEGLSALTRRGEFFVIIHDARKAVRPTPNQRSFAAKLQKRDAAYSGRWLLGTALVVSSPVISGVVTAINWIFPPPYPQKIFSTMDDAEAWATERLEAKKN